MDEKYAEELVDEVVHGKLPFHKVETRTGGDSNEAAKIRRRALERITNQKLTAIAHYTIDFNQLVGKNIETPIGVAQVPMGIAGPLRVKGDYANRDYFIPLCTSEGALVASINRGCSAINRSGGARSKVLKDGMARAPLFRTPSIEYAYKLVEWVNSNFKKIAEAAQRTTTHGRLEKIDPYVVGNNVFFRFTFTTGDAMGMNIVTIACDEIRRLIEEACPYADCVALSGNLCVDKKPSAMNLIQGRGKTVVSEAIIKQEIVNEVLKTTPKDIVEVNWRKNYIGSALAGSLGFNAHFANIIAAIFIATGQDVAQTVESSMGMTTVELLENQDLYISVTLPSLEVGTVGGGTSLPTQSEALKILDCYGSGKIPGENSKKLAEIIAATVLAGELSLLSALAAQHLAKTHLKLARGVKSI
jgi:hydroxymethylglutaryl-CoA reductase (NADPH)